MFSRMHYTVVGPDGKEYGPADISTIKKWVAEDRVRPDSVLKDIQTGNSLPASAVPGLFSEAAPPEIPPAPVNLSQPTSYHVRPRTPVANEGMRPLWGVIFRSVAAVQLSFVVPALALFVAGNAMYYAIQLKSRGSRYGKTAVGIASAALLAVGIGWLLRLIGARA